MQKYVQLSSDCELLPNNQYQHYLNLHNDNLHNLHLNNLHYHNTKETFLIMIIYQ